MSGKDLGTYSKALVKERLSKWEKNYADNEIRSSMS